MGYLNDLNEALTNKLILFLKIIKFDNLFGFRGSMGGEWVLTLDKNATEMEIIYQQIFCVKIICEILVEPK